jgi:hypothetical protein
MSAWGTLEALAAEETLLIADERFDDLAELNARRALLLAALPSPLPAVATGPLRRALSIQRATATVLQARCDALGTELGRRGVEAGSRVLPAGDEMLQTLVNLKH